MPRSVKAVTGPLLVVALIGVVYFETLVGFLHDWRWDGDARFGPAVPLAAAFWALLLRLRNGSLQGGPDGGGYAWLAAAAILDLAGTIGDFMLLDRLGLITAIAGCVRILAGTEIFRRYQGPLLLLYLTVPLPPRFYTVTTAPLMVVAARMAETVLDILRVPVALDGERFWAGGYAAAVPEVFRILRPVGFFLAAGLLAAALGRAGAPRRLLAVVLALPAAVLLAAGRAVVLGWVAARAGPSAVASVEVLSEGWIFFLLLFAGLWLVAGPSFRPAPDRVGAGEAAGA